MAPPPTSDASSIANTLALKLLFGNYDFGRFTGPPATARRRAPRADHRGGRPALRRARIRRHPPGGHRGRGGGDEARAVPAFRLQEGALPRASRSPPRRPRELHRRHARRGVAPRMAASRAGGLARVRGGALLRLEDAV